MALKKDVTNKKYKPPPQTAPQGTQSTATTQARQPIGRPPPPPTPPPGGGGRPTPGGTTDPSDFPGEPYPGAGRGQFGLIPGGAEGDPNYSWLGKGGEYWAPGRWSVAPAGGNVLAALMGGRAGAGNLGDWTGLGTLFDDGGTGDPLYQTRKAFDTWLKTGGVVDSRPELQKGIFASNALWDQQAPKQQTFADWFDIGNLGGATGPLVQRLMGGGAADWGYSGQEGALETQPFKGFQFIQQALAQNPYLDPEAERAFMDQYVQQMGGANTMPGATGIANMLRANMQGTDTTGAAGGIARGLLNDTNRLNNSYEDQLYRDIDTEAQRTLAMQLPEVQAQMAAAGLDRSGASRGAAQQLYSDVLGQALRDKQRTMAGFAETGRGLTAQALGQGAQGEFGALADSAGRMGQGILTGAQGQFGALESDAARLGQSILGAQQAGAGGLQREHERYGMEQDNYLRAILGSEAARLQGLGGQLNAQQQAQQAFMQLFGMQEDSYNNALERMLGLGEQQRLIDQQRLSGQIQAGQVPLQIMMQLATGATGSTFTPQQASNPWADLGMGALGNLAGGAAQGIFGGGEAPGFLQSILGSEGGGYRW